MTIPPQVVPYPDSGTGSRADARRRAEARLQELQFARETFKAHWKDLAEYVKPRRGRWFISDVNRGDRRNQKIVDSTATIALRTLSAGMMSGITNPARQWFRLTTPDPELSDLEAVKRWLHTVQQRMNTVLLRSNYYQVLPIHYTDLGLFGTACMTIEEDEDDVIRCTAFPAGSYYIANDAYGRVRVFAREFQMKVRDIIERFCMDPATRAIDFARCSSQVETAYRQRRYEQMVDVVHLVEANRDYQPSRGPSRFKAYRSCYWERGVPPRDQGAPFLEEKGYDEFPALASRWEVSGEDDYGTSSPGMEALGDIRQLQLGEKRIFQGIEKMISPPMQAAPALRNTRLNFAANELSFTTHDASGVKPMYEVKPQLDHLEGKQSQVRDRINRVFFADLFLMLANDQRNARATAREIEERHEEKLLALGPVLEQLNQDLLNPTIDRVFAIMLRRGFIPEPPDELRGVKLRVEYVSLMASAQKMVGVGSLERLMGRVSEAANVSGQPDMMDKINTDEWVDELADALGAAPRVLRSKEEVEQLRAGRARVQQRAQDAEIAKAEAEATAKLASAKTGGEQNALTDLLGLGGGVPGSPGVVQGVV